MQANILADDVRMEELVKMTTGKTGLLKAYVKATDYSLLRLYEAIFKDR